MTRTLIAVLGILVLLQSRAFAQGDKAPAPIPDAEWPAWVKSGASPGFMGQWITGLERFDLRYQKGRGYIPAFRFDEWPPKQKLSSLPAVSVSFGLDCRDLNVTDADLKEMAGLKKLQSLRLSGTQVTGSGLKELAALSGLQNLDLGNTKVDDAGLKELSGSKSLQSLLLDGTSVTDAGLRETAAIKSLRMILLTRTKVTEEGIRAHKKSLPDCRVLHAKWGDPAAK